MQCYTKAYKGFIKYTAQACAVYLLMVRCGELWMVPFSVNSLIKSNVSCYACRLYSALKWQNMTCRQSTRASGLLLNAIFALIIIGWSGTDQLRWKSNLVPVSLNGNSIMSSPFFFFWLISPWEISPSVICIQLAIIFYSSQFIIQMGCKSWSIYLLFKSFFPILWNSNGTRFGNFGFWIFSQLCQHKLGINSLEPGELVICDIESTWIVASPAYSYRYCWKSKQTHTLGRIPYTGPSVGL